MKSFGKISILLVLSFVLLVGCNNPFKKTEQQPQERVYSCADLKNETARADCVAQTTGIALDALNSEILHTFDTKRCVELPQEMADECVKTIQESGVQGPISDEQIQALRDAMDPSYKIPEGSKGEDIESEPYYDVTKCTTLTVTGFKEYCEKQLNKRIEEETMSKIIESGDATKCDELKDETFKRTCKIELGAITETSEKLMIEEPAEGTTGQVGVPAPEMLEGAVEPAEPVNPDIAQ
jgi:hypothetical protein